MSPYLQCSTAAPGLDQTFLVARSAVLACGMMFLAALDALIAGVKVHCEVVERDQHGRQGLLAQRGRHRPQVGVSGLGAGVPAVPDGLRDSQKRGPKCQAGDVLLREALGVARIVTAAGHTGTFTIGLPGA